ncbi:MAG: TGS domain-containing protein [Candidatus Bathyarchaeia archaeon]
MPANLTAEAKAKWERAIAIKDPEEKIKALQEFLSAIPKHKGNERLRDQVKRKIAALRAELEERRERRKGPSKPVLEKEGAAQILIIGPTNVGKSLLLSALTNARPEIASHPFTTRVPTPGVMRFEDIRFQLVEMPALVEGGLEAEAIDMIRRADGLIIMVDLGGDPANDLDWILRDLDAAGISPTPPRSSVEVERAKGIGEPKIITSGRLVGCTIDDVKKLVLGLGLRGMIIRIQGNVSLEEIEDALLSIRKIYKPCLVLANKSDLGADPEKFARLKEIAGDKIPVLKVSASTGEGLGLIGPELLRALGIIRVYTKEPNEREPSGEPFILKAGSSVADLAKRIHSSLLENYKYARVWGPSSKYPGERVGPSHILMDRDIVEIRTK